MNFTSNSTHTVINSVADVSMDQSAVSTLDERLIQAYAGAAFGAALEQNQVLQKFKILHHTT